MTPAEALETLPKRIKVGPYTYTLSVFETDEEMGYILADQQIIGLSSKHVSGSQVVGTVLHELLHAIWIDRGLGKRANEEQLVLAYETGLVQLFQDNPKLITWIKRGLKQTREY